MTGTTRDQHRPSRRTVVRGAAWAVPTVAVATAAPAFAASSCTTSACPNLAFGAVASANSTTAGNGWSYTQTASSGGWTNTNSVGFQPAGSSSISPVTGKGPTFATAAEPNTSNRQITLTQTGQPALSAACSYTVRVGIITYTSSSTRQVLRVLVGGTSIGTYNTGNETTNNNTNFDRGIKSFPVPTGTTGAVSFRLEFGAAGDHEDIHLYSPSITCA